MSIGLNPGAPEHIAIFVENLEGGGAEKIVATLANYVAEKDLDVDMDLVMQNARGHFLASIVPRVERFDIAAEGIFYPFRVLKFLAGYLRRRRPMILLAHMEKPSLLAIVAGCLAGYGNIIPCVHTDLTAYARLEHRKRRTLLLHAVKLLYPYASCIVAVSEGTAQVMRSLLGARCPPVHVVMNGFDFAEIRRLAAAEPDLPWLRQKTAPVIMACGRLVPQKGFDILLRAFAELHKTMPSRLVILGDGPMRPALLALAEELGIKDDVALPGFAANPYPCFARGDLFVLSSRVEGLSNVLIEALAVGTPIVSTDCPPGPREVLAGGKFGRLVPVDDVQAMAEAMKEELQRPKPSRPDAALEAHLQSYSVDSMVKGYMKIYEQAKRARMKKPV
ncbi:MAG: glycosyltransferase [Alphaproteobacteria bacterium]